LHPRRSERNGSFCLSRFPTTSRAAIGPASQTRNRDQRAVVPTLLFPLSPSLSLCGPCDPTPASLSAALRAGFVVDGLGQTRAKARTTNEEPLPFVNNERLSSRVRPHGVLGVGR
jgi:hypothetical protein